MSRQGGVTKPPTLETRSEGDKMPSGRCALGLTLTLPGVAGSVLLSKSEGRGTSGCAGRSDASTLPAHGNGGLTTCHGCGLWLWEIGTSGTPRGHCS